MKWSLKTTRAKHANSKVHCKQENYTELCTNEIQMACNSY